MRRSAAVLEFRLYFKPLYIPLNLHLPAAIFFFLSPVEGNWETAGCGESKSLKPERTEAPTSKKHTAVGPPSDQQSAQGETRSMAADNPDPSSGDGKNLHTCWIYVIARRTNARPSTPGSLFNPHTCTTPLSGPSMVASADSNKGCSEENTAICRAALL